MHVNKLLHFAPKLVEGTLPLYLLICLGRKLEANTQPQADTENLLCNSTLKDLSRTSCHSPILPETFLPSCPLPSSFQVALSYLVTLPVQGPGGPGDQQQQMLPYDQLSRHYSPPPPASVFPQCPTNLLCQARFGLRSLWSDIVMEMRERMREGAARFTASIGFPLKSLTTVYL